MCPMCPMNERFTGSARVAPVIIDQARNESLIEGQLPTAGAMALEGVWHESHGDRLTPSGPTGRHGEGS